MGEEPGLGLTGGKGAISDDVRRRVLRQTETLRAATYRRSRLLVPGSTVPTVAETTATEAHVLQSDFLNVVGSPTGGSTEVEIVRDANAQMRLYVVAGGAAAEAFAVGGIYINVTGVNPGTELGYGTWSAFGSGRVLVGLDSGDADFDTVEETGGSKAPSHSHTLSGSLSAEAAHTHSVTSNVSVDAHASHTHSVTSNVSVDRHSIATDAILNLGSGADPVLYSPEDHAVTNAAVTSSSGGPTTHTANNPAVTSGAGSSHTHANGTLAAASSTASAVQPYIVVHMWKRTA